MTGFFGIESFNPPWDIIYLPLFNALIGLYDLLFSDLALAIIALTLIIRTLLAPLFVRQIRSQKEMQRMQPLVREIQRKHKGNQRKISEETTALYREHGVNMFGGCLPLLLQLPILFALYQALVRASSIVSFTPSEDQAAPFNTFLATNPDIVPLGNNQYQIPFEGACAPPPGTESFFSHFLPLNCQLITPFKLDAPVDTIANWLTNPFTGVSLNLATVDDAFSVVIFGGFAISLLAVIAGALQFIQVRMTSPRATSGDPTASTQQTMTYLFPIMTIVWGGIFPSGLVLYWGVYTAYLIVQQYMIMGWGNLFPLFGWQPRWAPAPEAGDLGLTKPAGATPPPTDGRSTPEPARPGGQQRSGRRRRGREGRRR